MTSDRVFGNRSPRNMCWSWLTRKLDAIWRDEVTGTGIERISGTSWTCPARSAKNRTASWKRYLITRLEPTQAKPIGRHAQN